MRSFLLLLLLVGFGLAWIPFPQVPVVQRTEGECNYLLKDWNWAVFGAVLAHAKRNGLEDVICLENYRPPSTYVYGGPAYYNLTRAQGYDGKKLTIRGIKKGVGIFDATFELSEGTHLVIENLTLANVTFSSVEEKTVARKPISLEIVGCLLKEKNYSGVDIWIIRRGGLNLSVRENVIEAPVFKIYGSAEQNALKSQVILERNVFLTNDSAQFKDVIFNGDAESLLIVRDNLFYGLKRWGRHENGLTIDNPALRVEGFKEVYIHNNLCYGNNRRCFVVNLSPSQRRVVVKDNVFENLFATSMHHPKNPDGLFLTAKEYDRIYKARVDIPKEERELPAILPGLSLLVGYLERWTFRPEIQDNCFAYAKPVFQRGIIYPGCFNYSSTWTLWWTGLDLGVRCLDRNALKQRLDYLYDHYPQFVEFYSQVFSTNHYPEQALTVDRRTGDIQVHDQRCYEKVKNANWELLRAIKREVFKNAN